jgi:hypothetical protein
MHAPLRLFPLIQNAVEAWNKYFWFALAQTRVHICKMQTQAQEIGNISIPCLCICICTIVNVYIRREQAKNHT